MAEKKSASPKASDSTKVAALDTGGTAVTGSPTVELPNGTVVTNR